MSINKKNIIRFTVLFLILALMVPMLSGCGVEGAGYTKVKYDGKTEPSLEDDEPQNYSLINWNGKHLTVTYTDRDGTVHTNEKFSGLIKGGRIDANDPSEKQKPGFYLTRQVAVFMYESVFGNKRDGDIFVSEEEKWDSLSLTPIEVIRAVNTETANQITTNSGEGGVLESTIALVQSAASAILIAVWSMGFISQIVNERFSMDTLLKTFMQLLCGILIVLNAEDITVAFFNTGNDLLTNLIVEGHTAESVFESFQKEISNELNTMHVWNMGVAINGLVAIPLGTIYIDIPSIMVILYLLLPLIAQILCAYKIISMMIMRMFELIARIAFSAIPIAFGAQNGFGPETIRYFRGVMACALQPVLMLVGVLLFDSIGNAAMAIAADIGAGAGAGAEGYTVTGLVGSLVMTLSYFILSAYLGETKQLAQEIIAR